ncbi:MAG: alpha-L-arabinofuranosidase C-terminal domain-containing protein [Prevotella sp.]|jgi:alpha-L-arabinofuranosidase
MNLRNFILSSLLLPSMGMWGQVQIDVDALHPGISVSPMLYGIFYEDINHAADGGLYAELISNRSFEDNDKQADGWQLTASGEKAATMRLVTKSLLNNAQHQALEVTFKGSQELTGVSNSGFWGINAVQGRTYRVSFWAKGKLNAPLIVRLTDATGHEVYAEAPVSGKLQGRWQRYSLTLTSKGNDSKARLSLVSKGKGRVCFDVVSMMPPTFKNRANGLRPDLANMLADLHPKFLRFPGGCFVEGQESPDNAFRWERTIGPIETRPGHKNVNWGYRTSDGLGFDEYLQMAEDLGAKPLYVVNVGLWHGGKTPVDSLQSWIDETLNALEYANGPVTSKYGALRAKNGHPAPYNIEYLEIGNENNQPDPNQQSDHYYDRFKKFKEAVLARYPKMHLIGNVAAWGTDDPKWESTESVELVDEHYYRNPAWFAENFHKYDSYSRKGPKVYVGEYAVTQGFGNHGSLNAALGEAVYMMGLENNSDVVRMASYAPIFANVNDLKWRPDMIQFDGTHAFGTPSYYVQRIMADNVGTRVLPVKQTSPYEINREQERVKPETCQVGVGTWGTEASFISSKVDVVDLKKSEIVESDKTTRGVWKSEGNIYRQTSDQEGAMLIDEQRFTADEYTYNVRARKDKGAEGFLVVFNYVDPDNYCWLNLGGWGNTQHAIEQIIDGSKSQLAMTPGSVKEGQWYDVTLHVKGDSIYASLDGKQIFATKLKPSSFAGLFSSASLDEKTGETIVKVVNTAREATSAHISLSGKQIGQASVIRLSSAKGTDENSLENPTMVTPVKQTLSPEKDGLDVTIPGNSLNVIRIK